MKRSFLIIATLFALVSACERERRTIVLIPPPSSPICNEVQTQVDTYYTGDLVIPAGCSVIISRVLVISGGTLRVEEGAVLYFDLGSEIVIDSDGNINVVGTAVSPVVFTSAYEPPLRGDWEGITIYSTGDNTISHGRIEYATRGISLYGEVYVDNTEFYYNFYGLKTESVDTYFVLLSSSFSGNEYALYLLSDTLTLLSDSIYFDTGDYIYVDGSDGVINSGIWPPYIYIFLTDVVIDDGARIDVSGADIYVVPPYEIIVRRGAAFRAYNTYFLTNSPTYNCWGGISFEGADPSSYLDTCVIKDAGAGPNKANVAVIDTYGNGESLEITNSEISYGCADGVYILNSDVLIDNCEIHNNLYYGVYVDCYSTVDESGNEYYSNGYGDIGVNPSCS